MAAEIRPKPTARRPILLSKLEGSGDIVNQAVIIPKEDGVISVCDDRTVRVWLKRDSGQYWPSICHTMPAAASALDYNPETRRLFVGLENGTISEFLLADDFNRMAATRNYLAHQQRVVGINFSLQCEWLLSVGRDKFFQWHCSETGRRLGGFQSGAWCTAVQFDVESKHVFVGDFSGHIQVLKLEGNGGVTQVTTLKGHSGSIRCLEWDPESRLLFSGSFDQSIIVWDIGGQQGTAFELQGHNNKVQGLKFVGHTKQLVSGGEDGMIVIWNMSVDRNETPEWVESDNCQKCDQPFFWNFKKMWNEKTIGTRQHHCRKCGSAVCAKCSANRSTIPLMGFEFEVRVCNACFANISDDERAPMATFHEVKHGVVAIHYDGTRGWLLTCGTDRIIKIWDVNALVS
ncbi:WD repeat and FYVE domain-containing protein 2-like [Branchiostoma floridae]|uniref:WD repeat and FYVE domain-containing protein 2-like n=1 Tax=Branchiostoma floridae TaxID=7739 RepID=C3ZF43_BRAFL|nr:WD repeat and FYVE domain-containing protein 2-like [Branchiostoma floridae]|eukprot:XP_002593338.1 hypothetical protein BRAFLDRAFT_70886 [Branchiostoma floridae]